MTKSEKEFQSKVRAQGCIVCILDLNERSDGDIHHILNGNRRIGEMDVLCLCPSHHRFGIDNEIATSRHPYLARFVKRYGTEAQLLAKTKELLSGGDGV